MVDIREDQKKVFLDWMSFGSHLEKLLDKIKQSKQKFTGIYGVPRGGLAIALYLSHNLNLKMLDSPIENCLIVDDINDSGKTLRDIVKDIKAYKIATIYQKDKTLLDSHFYKEMIKEEHWIVFPWETKRGV